MLAVSSCVVVFAMAGGCKIGSPAATVSTPAAAVASVSPGPAPVVAVPAEPVFADPAVAAPAVVGSLLAAAPGKILGDLDALSQRLSLPIKLGRELLSSLGSFGFPGGGAHLQAILDRLDAAAPVAIVWVLSEKSRVKGFCAAMTFKESVGARRTFDEMGTLGAERNGVSERRTSDGDLIWGGIKGRTLFISGSAEALLFAGALAEKAQIVPPASQVVLTVLPQALAKASGQSPDALVARLASTMSAAAKSGQAKLTPAFQRTSIATAEVMARLALDSSAIRLLVDAGPRDGFGIRVEAVPAAGTDFAVRTARRAPCAFDARLPVRDDGTALFALGDLWPMFANWGKLFEASGPAGRGFWRDVAKMSDVTVGPSCIVDFTGVAVSTLCSAALRPGTSPRAALDAAVAMLNSQQAWEGELEGRKATPLKIKRSRDMVEIDKKVENKDPMARALAKAIAGGDTIKYALSVKDGHLLQAFGRNPRELSSRYGNATSPKDAPLVAATLARTNGAEAVASIDVISFVLRLLGKGNGLPGGPIAAVAGSLPGVAEMKAPFVFTLRGGEALSGEFQIPLGSLDAVAKVVRSVLGSAGGRAPQ
jgi:hypothetical protein